MTVELRPFGVKCNIQCQYCYQNPQRDAGNFLHEYDLKVMMDAVEAEGGPFALFGGEPLLMPLRDLEKLWEWGLAKYGQNSIQTNGVLITDEHIRLFEKYRVGVGISLDGPEELNDARWAGSAERTREATAGVQRTIRALCERGTPPTLIVTLHRGNATADKLPRMREWLLDLERMGVRSARLHLLEVDHASVREAYALSADENRVAVREFADLEARLTTLKLDLFDDIRRMLAGKDDGVTCVWGACDPYTTSAVRGVEGNGQRSNCGRTNKDGIDFAKADVEGFERYLALYHTPQEHGGCGGCRFFLFCKGQCPGTALGNDWRNRSEHCEVWMESYASIEADVVAAGRIPLSLSPDLPRLERFFLSAWESGHNTSLEHAVASLGNFDTPVRTRRIEVPAGSPRLGFELPPFTRVAWTGDAARRAWAGRFDRLRAVTAELSWRAAAAGLVSCAVVPRAGEPVDWAARGLAAEALGADREVVGPRAAVDEFLAAVEAGDDSAIARLLGTPECCEAALRDLWFDGGKDPTWEAAAGTANALREGDTVAADGHPLAHGLWRWLGIRPVAHLACRFDCPATVALAERVVALGRALGYGEEMDVLEDIHGWPIEWSSLHGIAEVRTPVVKISTRTDALAARRVVRFRGTGRYPAEAAKGVRFPYVEPPKPLLTLSAGYRRGLANAAAARPAKAAPPDSILKDSLEALVADGRVDGRSLRRVVLTPYFTVAQLDDGTVGAAMSYYTPEEAAAIRPKLPGRVPTDPLWLGWLFDNPDLAEHLGLPAPRADLVARSLRTAVLSALTAPLLAGDGGGEFRVADRPSRDPFATARRAVVIGFGGYIDRLAAAANIEHLHVCDLGYRTRREEMDGFAAGGAPGRITISDGTDVAERIAACDAIAITGSALSNGTMEELLRLSSDGRRAVVVQGQSAGIHPTAFFRRGATLVVTTAKPPELADAADADPTGDGLRRYLEGGLPWRYVSRVDE